jgi:hypothetical protein
MKTTKGIVITFLGDGGVCLRAEWFNNGQNVLIKGMDFKPDLLFVVVNNMRLAKESQENPYNN